MAQAAGAPSVRPLPTTPTARPGRFTLGEWSVPLLALPAAAFLLVLAWRERLYHGAASGAAKG